MLIKPYEAMPAEEPRIVCPNDNNYQLPVSIVGGTGLTMQDEELLQTMAEYSPRTKFKPGDYAWLQEVPYHLKRRHETLPQIWEIRFVVSAWAYELMMTRHHNGAPMGMDRAIHLVSEMRGLKEHQYRSPMIYAHGACHGTHPNTAAWLPERVLRKLVFRSPRVTWPEVVEEAGAWFQGYDPDKLAAPFVFSMAPDDYSHGKNIGKPMLHEESTVHAACCAGLEEALMVPLIVKSNKRAAIDPHHDAFQQR